MNTVGKVSSFTSYIHSFANAIFENLLLNVWYLQARTVEVAGACDVDVVVKDTVAVAAATSRPDRLCNSTITIFGITVRDDHIEIESQQVGGKLLQFGIWCRGHVV